MFLRNDRTFFSRWWWTIDRGILMILFTIIVVGIILNFAATPALAHRLGLDTFHFAKKHIIYIIPSISLLISASLLNPVQIRKVSLLLLVLCFILLLLTPVIGVEIKGAKRWITFGGLSLQISELIKPCFCVISGWMITKQYHSSSFKGIQYSLLLLISIVLLLLIQPDIGISVVMISSWFAQLFIIGLPLIWIVLSIAILPCALLIAYFLFPHVAYRIELFLSGHQNYQVMRSMEAFVKGGIWGQGPGEGTVKKYVPDAHADFIFAVAGEEFGIFFCLLIISLFAILSYRVIRRMYHSQSLFCILTVTGILTQLVSQSLINIASVLGLIPTKGMTLPFISYGGSSLIALAFSCSILLSLTKRHHDAGYNF